MTKRRNIFPILTWLFLCSLTPQLLSQGFVQIDLTVDAIPVLPTIQPVPTVTSAASAKVVNEQGNTPATAVTSVIVTLTPVTATMTWVIHLPTAVTTAMTSSHLTLTLVTATVTSGHRPMTVVTTPLTLVIPLVTAVT